MKLIKGFFVIAVLSVLTFSCDQAKKEKLLLNAADAVEAVEDAADATADAVEAAAEDVEQAVDSVAADAEKAVDSAKSYG